MTAANHYEVRGCPGGPGHPGEANRVLIANTATEVVEAVEKGTFNDLRPPLLVTCQCSLVEIIGQLAQQVADERA